MEGQRYNEKYIHYIKDVTTILGMMTIRAAKVDISSRMRVNKDTHTRGRK